MAYKGINFARQHLVPVDDGNLYRAIFQDGSLHGCQVSTSGAVLTMTAGYIMCAGRQIEITADESFTLNEQTSGYARILLQIDLTQTATESTFQQVSTLIQYAASEEGFATLIQQDINNGGSLYQMQLALVSLAAGGISAIVEDLPVAELRGGGGLNFSVVGGTTQPTGKENMIWVNTSTAISSWVFSATQPTSPVAGMVWFVTATASNVAFNAIKKNGIWVYPNSVYQYVNGNWVGETAKTYKNGAWVDWTMYLFSNGDEFVDTTGGWMSVGAYSLQKSGGLLTMSSGVGQQAVAYANNAIDITPFSTLSAVVTSSTHTAGNGRIVVSKTKVGNRDSGFAAQANTQVGTVSVDVTGLSGLYFVGIYSGYTCSVSVREMFLR